MQLSGQVLEVRQCILSFYFLPRAQGLTPDLRWSQGVGGQVGPGVFPEYFGMPVLPAG